MQAALVPRFLVSIAVVVPTLFASACAGVGGESPPVRVIAFLCEDGNSFRIEHVGGRVRLTTRAGSYWLQPAPSSIGAKFMSEKVAFIQDGDFGALNGAEGGPFRRCHESG